MRSMMLICGIVSSMGTDRWCGGGPCACLGCLNFILTREEYEAFMNLQEDLRSEVLGARSDIQDIQPQQRCRKCSAGAFYKQEFRLTNGEERTFYYCEEHRNPNAVVINPVYESADDRTQRLIERILNAT